MLKIFTVWWTFPASRLLYNRAGQCECCIGWQESPSSTAGADIPTVSFDKLMKFNLVGAVGAKNTENQPFLTGLNHINLILPQIYYSNKFNLFNFGEQGCLHHLEISGNRFAVTLSGWILEYNKIC